MLLTLFSLVACYHVLNVQAAEPKPNVNVTFPSTQPANANVVKDNFLGISIELSAFGILCGNDTESIPAAMLNYLSNIRSRMSNPLRIRIGGDSMDTSSYITSQTQDVLITASEFNSFDTTIGPTLFDVMNALANAAGSIQYLVGLSMQFPGNFSNSYLVAEAATSKLGGRLDCMMAGNEPDFYSNNPLRANYSYQDYVAEVGEIVANLTSSPQGNLLSSPLIGGPSVCCGWDLAGVLNAGLINEKLKYATMQHYPNNVCSGSTPQSSNISYYLSHTNVQPFTSWNVAGMQVAQNHSIPVLLTEFNTASCGGDPAVAPTFAAALWIIDVALNFTGLPMGGVYTHTRGVGTLYNLFTPPSISNDSGWTTGAPYYAQLVIAEALSNQSVVKDLNLDNSINDASATVAGYAIYDSEKRGKLVLINFDNNTDGTSDTTRTFNLPANISTTMGVRYLLAPTVNEEQNITWANQTVGTDGNLVGNQSLSIHACSSGCSISVPGPGVALVFLNPTNQTFVGNSTVVGTPPPLSTPASETSSAIPDNLLLTNSIGVLSFIAILVGIYAL